MNTEPKPTKPGNYYGELSIDLQWKWAGVGLPTDDWVPTEAKTPEPPPQIQVKKGEAGQYLTSSQLAYDWIEMYLTPVTGP